MQSHRHQITFHMPIFGDCGVGKSAFCNNVLHRPFNLQPLPTIGLQIHRFDILCLQIKVNYILYDSNGSDQERKRFNVFDYIDMFQTDSQQGEVPHLVGSLIIASKTDQKSIQKIDQYFNYSASKNKIPPQLIGLFLNKSDIQETDKLNTKEIHQYADNKRISFEEGSSKTSENIRKFFDKHAMKVVETCIKRKVFVINQPGNESTAGSGSGRGSVHQQERGSQKKETKEKERERERSKEKKKGK